MKTFFLEHWKPIWSSCGVLHWIAWTLIWYLKTPYPRQFRLVYWDFFQIILCAMLGLISWPILGNRLIQAMFYLGEKEIFPHLRSKENDIK